MGMGIRIIKRKKKIEIEREREKGQKKERMFGDPKEEKADILTICEVQKGFSFTFVL